ncbi:hypothetical protein CTI10_015595 [Delftia acidovorans]|nr:hypothetical protein CTI10_015595 [Delftia acidovorans]
MLGWKVVVVHVFVLAVVVVEDEVLDDEWDVSRRELDSWLYGLARRRGSGPEAKVCPPPPGAEWEFLHNHSREGRT